MSAPAPTDGSVPKENLPHGSIWPFFLAIAISVIGLGVVFLKTAPWLFFVGAAFVLLMVIGWVREDTKFWWTNTGTGKGMGRAGIIMFISSEVFIFGALFATYFTFQRLAGDNHGPWPDTDVHLPLALVMVFSLFLFASSWTIHKSEKALYAGDHKGFTRWLGITIILGLIFLAGQINEYMTLLSEGHGLTDGKFMTSFYMLTGTHGLHVMGGLIALIFAWVRAKKGQFNEDRHEYPAAAALYWHFVDLVWIFVLITLYIYPVFFGNPPGAH